MSLNGVHNTLFYVNTTVYVSLTHLLVDKLGDIIIFKEKPVLTLPEIDI